jgi:hypothetical protein
MKKTIVFILFAFFATGITYGQFALGVKVGYNANKLSTDLDSIKSQVNSGFHVGVFTRIGNRFYVAPELLYSMSGAVFTNEGNLSTNDWKQKITIGSLDVPVMLGFKIIHSDFITWRIELGPQASFNISKKVSDENSVLGPIQESSLSSMSWYAIGGTGIDMLFLSLDLRYKYGLNQLIQDAGNYTFDTQNQMFVVSLGFKILGKK